MTRSILALARSLLPAMIITAASFVGGVLAQQSPSANTYDLVLRNARIADGTGSPWYRADLAVRGDTIASYLVQRGATPLQGDLAALHIKDPDGVNVQISSQT